MPEIIVAAFPFVHPDTRDVAVFVLVSVTVFVEGVVTPLAVDEAVKLMAVSSSFVVGDIGNDGLGP